jgi:membrane fusion protein (multidrug efflux system)
MKRVLLTVTLATMAGLAGGCGQSKPPAVSAGAPVAEATPLAHSSAAPNAFYLATGPLVVENQVDVAAQRDGVIVKTMAEPGTPVKPGQMLGLLDDRQIAADLDAAQANVQKITFNMQNWEAELQALRKDLERSQKMWDAQLITKEQLEHDQYKVAADEFQVQRERQALRQAQATAKSLQIELEKTRIRAPFSGMVARRYVRVGQKVANGDRTFWVTATGPLRVKFTLPERFLGRVKKGEQLTVTSPDLPDEKYTAKVIEFSPVVDPSSGTIEVLAELAGSPGELRPGMAAQVRIHNSR